LILYLTKYHALKTYSALNYAPFHEVRGSEVIVPRILNLDTKWK